MSVGKNIKIYRKQKGFTQAQLAKAIGKKEVTIRKYENGTINPPITVIDEIAKVLKISINDLIDVNNKRIEYIKKLHNENPDDKKIQNIIKYIKQNGDLSDECIRLIDSYKETDTLDKALGCGLVEIIPNAEIESYNFFIKLLESLGYAKDEFYDSSIYLFKKIKAQIELEIRMLKKQE